MPTPALAFSPIAIIPINASFTILDANASVTDGGNILNVVQISLSSGLGTLGVFNGTDLTTSGTIGLITYQYNSVRKLLTLRDNTVGQTAIGADFTTVLRLVGYNRNGAGEDVVQTLSVHLGNPAFFPVTGHYYEFISGSIDWPTASTAASSKSFYGLTGYLSNVTSLAETSFLNLFFSGSVGWGGGTSTGTPAGTIGGNRIWKWGAGPEINTTFWANGSGGGYSNWNFAEPNNGGDNNNVSNIEPYLVLMGNNSFAWADASGLASGYYVEYSTASGIGNDGLAGTRYVSTLTISSRIAVLLEIATPIAVSLVSGTITTSTGVSMSSVTIGAANNTHMQVSINLGTSNNGKQRQAQGFRVVGGSERELIATRTRVGEVYTFVFLKTVDGSSSVNLLLK